MTSRRKILLLLRKHPGVTVTELADEVGLTGMGVRRHLDLLAADGLVENTQCPGPERPSRAGDAGPERPSRAGDAGPERPSRAGDAGPERRGSAGGRKRLGRPATGWRLSARGLELFPRRYDSLAIEVLEDISEQVGPEAVDAVFRRRTDKLVADYEGRLADAPDLEHRVAALTTIRDEAGYLAEWSRNDDDDDLVLTENNCAVHRVAERYPAVCAMELALLRRVMGPEVEVTRVAHTMAGDAVCSYCIRPSQR